MVQSSLQRDLKQIIVCLGLPWTFDVLMNNISAWITAAHNKLTMLKLAQCLLRTQTNRIPLVWTRECCSWMFSLKYLCCVKLLTLMKQRPLLCSGDLYRKTLEFVFIGSCVLGSCIYLGITVYMKSCTLTCAIHIPVERPALICRKKKWGKARTLLFSPSRWVWKWMCKDRAEHISIKGRVD